MKKLFIATAVAAVLTVINPSYFVGSLQYIGSLFRVDEPVPDDSYRDSRRITMQIKMSLSFCHFVTNKHFLILNDRDLHYCNSLL